MSELERVRETGIERNGMTQPIIRQLLVGPFAVFTYIVACPQTKEGVIIDPAGESERILSVLMEEGIRLRYILNTHGHADHVTANEALRLAVSAPTCMHEADNRFFSAEAMRELSVKELGLPTAGAVERELKDGDLLGVGSLVIRTIHTPGHSPGSVCFYLEGNLFTGDTLFVGAAGRTDLTGGSLDTLIESIEKRILTLPKDTVIWPGHDYGDTPTSTIGREMEDNPYITDFILDG
jgi:glyoxylase-like metal-dependent hydrolase (beta-lactamase superfamily II)